MTTNAIKLLLLISSALLLCESSFAYKIIAQDKEAYVFHEGKIKSDPNRYDVVYEVDEANKTLIVIKEVDMRTGEEYSLGSAYQIVEQPTMELFKNGTALRAIRFNPKRANIETISFCDGKYHYSKTTEKYINLFYGNYKLEF